MPHNGKVCMELMLMHAFRFGESRLSARVHSCFSGTGNGKDKKVLLSAFQGILQVIFVNYM
jgi:hypothetical protein